MICWRTVIKYRSCHALHRYSEGEGYPPGLSLEILDLIVGLEPQVNKVYLHNLTILNVENIRGFESIDRGLAWRFNFGWKREYLSGVADATLLFAGDAALVLLAIPKAITNFTLYFPL